MTSSTNTADVQQIKQLNKTKQTKIKKKITAFVSQHISQQAIVNLERFSHL